MGGWNGYLSNPSLQNGITPAEFRALGLGMRAPAEAAQFVGALGAAQVALALTGRSVRRGLVGDKLYFDTLMRGAGFAVPRVQAVMGRDAGLRGVASLTRFQDLRAFLANDAEFPLFVKPVQGQRSDGVMIVTRFDLSTGRVFTHEGRMQLKEFAARLAPWAEHGVLLQSRLQQHPDLVERVGLAIGCVRMITWRDGQNLHRLGTFWKVPRQDAVADNHWRGNLLADVDMARGVVGKVVDRLDVAADAVERHPDTGLALSGTALPGWSDLMEMTDHAASFLSGLPLVGWDVALTQDGPVIVEANSSPSLDIPQYLTGHGLLAHEGVAEVWRKRHAKARAARKGKVAKRLSVLAKRRPAA
ncbi:MAG: sugar-transfer associated ATP-grasp domain-containing protein [Pseudomonadota bacterium]